jgi:hypothetical protein
MNRIDLHNAEQRNGAVYFVVGRGTEGGSASYRLSVAGVSTSEWGQVSAVAANSGYSLGTIQVDLGQRGDWPLGSTEQRPLAAGEQTYVDAIVGQVSTYATTHHLSFPSTPNDLADLAEDLHSHGNGQNGRSSIRYISAAHRDTINAWASSDEGKQWIHSHIDYPQIQSLADSAQQVLDAHGQNIPEDKRFQVLCILAKSANQHPATFNALSDALRQGADHATFMDKVAERTSSIGYYAGGKAGDLAEIYQDNYQKPGLASQMQKAHTLVAQPGYQPAQEAQWPSVQVALAAYQRRLNDPSVLDRGDQGDDVRVLQQALIGSGQNLTDDGDFGRGTERALTAFQHAHGLESTGFGDRPTLRALHIAPMLDERSSASLHRLIESLNDDPRFTESQIGHIAASAQLYMLDQREALGDISQIRMSNDGQTLLFQNDYLQMRTLATDQAIRGYVPAQPLVQAPAASIMPETQALEDRSR